MVWDDELVIGRKIENILNLRGRYKEFGINLRAVR
jgi:hypothetical protein